MENVTFGYSPDRILLKNIDFGVHLSSRVSIVGPNGIGKSTLVKLIEGKGINKNVISPVSPTSLMIPCFIIGVMVGCYE